MTQEQLDQLRHEYGLDKPVVVQYVNWVKGVATGDLGKSIMYRADVGELLKQRFPPTLYLGLIAIVVSTVLGVFFGLMAAIRRGKWIDSVVTFFSYIGLTVPVFLLGILLMYVFGLKLGWLPIAGYVSPFANFGLFLRMSVIPVICLAVVPWP